MQRAGDQGGHWTKVNQCTTRAALNCAVVFTTLRTRTHNICRDEHETARKQDQCSFIDLSLFYLPRELRRGEWVNFFVDRAQSRIKAPTGPLRLSLLRIQAHQQPLGLLSPAGQLVDECLCAAWPHGHQGAPSPCWLLAGPVTVAVGRRSHVGRCCWWPGGIQLPAGPHHTPTAVVRGAGAPPPLRLRAAAEARHDSRRRC